MNYANSLSKFEDYCKISRNYAQRHYSHTFRGTDENIVFHEDLMFQDEAI